MIHHQNADAMGLASALMRGITPLDVRHFDYMCSLWHRRGIPAENPPCWRFMHDSVHLIDILLRNDHISRICTTEHSLSFVWDWNYSITK
jgi:hypothetical protein